MRSSQSEAIRPDIETAIHDIDELLTSIAEGEKTKVDLVEVYRRMEAGEQKSGGWDSRRMSDSTFSPLVLLAGRWRSSASRAAKSMFRADLAAESETIWERINSLRDPVDFPRLGEFLEQEKKAAEEVKRVLTALLTGAGKRTEDVGHSTDFRSVRWFGSVYSFTVNQARVIELLFENWRAGTPDVGDETLLMSVDREAPPARLSTLFRDHPAWNTMIVPGGSKGTHRLAKPAEEIL